MPLSYALASERADNALYEVRVKVACPGCDQKIPCTVRGDSAACYPCPSGCEYDGEDVCSTAVAIAAGHRADYAAHLREQS